MSRRLIWPAVAIVLTWINARLAFTGERDDSLCNTSRDLLRTDTFAGSVIFTALLAGFWAHIIHRVPLPGAKHIVVLYRRGADLEESTNNDPEYLLSMEIPA